MQHTHIRFYNEETQQIDNRRGATVAWETDGNKIRISVAACSEMDNFNRKTGREHAASRLESGDYIEFNGTELLNAQMSSVSHVQSEGLVRAMCFLLAQGKGDLYYPASDGQLRSEAECNSYNALEYLKHQMGIHQ